MILLYFDVALEMIARGIINAISEMGIALVIVFMLVLPFLMYIDKEENKK